MRIDDQLRLVLPVDDRIQAYHVPISREVFEANYLLLACTKAMMMGKGAAFMADAGPRVAALMLKEEGKRDAMQRGEVDEQGNPLNFGAQALLQDIQRLTTILEPGPTGWESIPVSTAIQRGLMDAESWAEVESSLVFFTCHSSMARKSERAKIFASLAIVLGGAITSCSITDYLASSTTSPADESTPKAASSVPS